VKVFLSNLSPSKCTKAKRQRCRKIFCIDNNEYHTKIPPKPPPLPLEEKRAQNQDKEGGGIPSKVEVLSLLPNKYLHQKTRKTTLKLARVEIVEISEVFSECIL
jgi:hypothetical protein